MFSRPKRNQQPNKKQSKSVAQRDSLQVFCRLRPTNASETCIKVISDTVIQVTTPESYASARNVSVKQMQYTFQKVFDERSTQQQVFSEMALPLVDHLIHGRNGLLFTYGVTGSGKTYTMSGIPSDVGIMPRCLDILFNSIGSLQAKKFMFKPDKLNGFDVQTEAEALLDRQAEINSKSRPGLRYFLFLFHWCSPKIFCWSCRELCSFADHSATIWKTFFIMHAISFVTAVEAFSVIGQ